MNLSYLIPSIISVFEHNPKHRTILVFPKEIDAIEFMELLWQEIEKSTLEPLKDYPNNKMRIWFHPNIDPSITAYGYMSGGAIGARCDQLIFVRSKHWKFQDLIAKWSCRLSPDGFIQYI